MHLPDGVLNCRIVSLPKFRPPVNSKCAFQLRLLQNGVASVHKFSPINILLPPLFAWGVVGCGLVATFTEPMFGFSDLLILTLPADRVL